MYWLIMVFAVVVTLWSFWRCGKLLQRLESINTIAKSAMDEVNELMEKRTDMSLAEEVEILYNVVRFVAIVSDKERKG